MNDQLISFESTPCQGLGVYICTVTIMMLVEDVRLLGQRFYYYSIANSINIMLALAPHVSQVPQGQHGGAQLNLIHIVEVVSRLRQPTAFIVNESKATLCLEGNVTSSIKVAHCSPEKWSSFKEWSRPCILGNNMQGPWRTVSHNTPLILLQ